MQCNFKLSVFRNESRRFSRTADGSAERFVSVECGDAQAAHDLLWHLEEAWLADRWWNLEIYSLGQGNRVIRFLISKSGNILGKTEHICDDLQLNSATNIGSRDPVYSPPRFEAKTSMKRSVV